MKNCPVSALFLAATLCAAGAQAQGDKSVVVRLDPAHDALVPAGARLELVKGGFGFTESVYKIGVNVPGIP